MFSTVLPGNGLRQIQVPKKSRDGVKLIPVWRLHRISLGLSLQGIVHVWQRRVHSDCFKK